VNDMSTSPGTAPIPKTFRQRMLIWLWNALNAFVNGFAGVGAADGLVKLSNAAPLTSRQFWSIAIATGVVGLFNYIRSNRLPDLFTTNGG